MIEDEKWMNLAIEQAIKAQNEDEVPVGAVLIKDGLLIAKAHNQPISTNDATAHAEIQVLRKAGRKLGNYRLTESTLYVTLEPCAMCAGSAYWAGLGRLVYSLSEHSLKQITGNHPENPTLDLPCRTVFESGQREVEIIGPVMEEEGAKLHEGFWD